MFLDALEPPVVSASNAFGIIKKYLKLEKCEQLFDHRCLFIQRFSKNLGRACSWLIRWIPHSIPLHCNSEALHHCIMRHELVANRSSLLGVVYSFIIIRYYINYTITYQSVWILLTREEPLATDSWRIMQCYDTEQLRLQCVTPWLATSGL